ncbi:MAG: NAD(+) diphosphatase [Alphaproteobacteria bacterium]|nr:NAD(+) diphosphatase [Alphaproteobacteria bacterium]
MTRDTATIDAAAKGGPDARTVCAFDAAPLDRASELRSDPEWVAAQQAREDAVLLPLWRGDPLIVDGAAGWLSFAARSEFREADPVVFLGLDKQGRKPGRPRFAIDCGSRPSPETAPFTDFGAYTNLREAAGVLSPDDLAIVGQARWLLDWHARHGACARCGAETVMRDAGAKRECPSCGAEHFPRSDPVAIVLATNADACLLGRGPHFPPGFYSALAGYVEACETPEACAIRELKEEAGIDISNVRYQFSQPWPFPSSLMMGFFAEAAGRELTLDPREIADALWVPRATIRKRLNGEDIEIDGTSVNVPPRFTIARRLIERWAAD